MTDEKKTEATEMVTLKFKKTTFKAKNGVQIALIEKYSGNGISASDGETINVKPDIATQLLYNLPENFELVSKGKIADDVAAKAKAHIDNRLSRQKMAQKELDDKAAKQPRENKAAFSK